MKTFLLLVCLIFTASNASKLRQIETQVFQKANNVISAKCADSNIKWASRTWTTGSVRSFHQNTGASSSLDECKDRCSKEATCSTAIYTASKKCFFLNTNEDTRCQVAQNGNFGESVENCTVQRPCSVLEKICGSPNCSLSSIITTYCNTKNQNRSVTICTN